MSKKKITKTAELFHEIQNLIHESRTRVALTVNAELSLLYWHIGNRINSEILQDKRAEYGQKIIANLSEKLTAEFGKGWSVKHLRHCLRSAETFPDEKIFSTIGNALTWTHLKMLI
ncbi:MAG: DUF1016 N-terminal domain-containing protein, partial [Planctomycetota bacterium]